MGGAVDYSSKHYWRERLRKEQDVGFEWLLPSSHILSIITSITQDTSFTHTPIRILHFGCGSSTLGQEIQQRLGIGVAVSDVDYASASLRPRGSMPSTPGAQLSHPVPLYEVDVLDVFSLRSITPAGGWDLFVDKSTADAISCSPPLTRPPSSEQSHLGKDVEALEILCDNLSLVSSLQSRWISISYSASRFDFLDRHTEGGWQVLDKFPAKLESKTRGNNGHVVHQPETGIWVWILGRQ